MSYFDLIKVCYSISDFCRMNGIPLNGRGFKTAKKIINDNNLDISHFDGGKNKKIKYDRIKRICPVCNLEFDTHLGGKREKRTCSKSCSNVLFRSGRNNGNWKDIAEYGKRSRTYAIKYRNLCFQYHKHECVVCGENKILDVHHFDGDNLTTIRII